MRGQGLFCTTIAISTSQNTFENRFTLARNVSEKCNREMIRGQINARDETTCHAEVAVARSLALWQSSDPMESTLAASPAVFDSKSGKTST